MPHVHDWSSLREGFPQLICKCGGLRAKHVKVGSNTITMSPLGTGDNLMRFTTAAPSLTATGDISVDTNSGRPVVINGGLTRSLNMVDQPDQNRQWTWAADTSSTTVLLDGTASTLGAVGTPTLVRTSSGSFINYNSAGAGDFGPGRTGTTFTSAVTQSQYSPYLAAYVRFGPGAVSNIRVWVALAGSDTMVTALPSSTLGFRFDSSGGDTTWVAYTSDSTTPNAQSTGITVAANTVYFLMMRCTTSRCDFWASVAGGTPTVTTSTSNFPTTVTSLNAVCLGRPTLAVSNDFGFSKFSVMEGQRIV